MYITGGNRNTRRRALIAHINIDGPCVVSVRQLVDSMPTSLVTPYYGETTNDNMKITLHSKGMGKPCDNNTAH